MSPPSFDELLAQLTEADVRFVVVGGLALGAWGAVRGTKDCDIVPDPAPDNLDRLAAVVVRLSGRVQLEGSLTRRGAVDRRAAQTGRASADLDATRRPGCCPGHRGRPALQRSACCGIEVEIAGATVAICALEHLRAMKRAAGRPRDLVDLDDLDAAQPDDG